jgi:CheY-like chemotaxis protein
MEQINKVVFIDDDIATNDYHKYIFEKMKFAKEALFFTEAETALKYMEGIKNKYDFPELIFVDIKMPKMNGHEFVAAVMEIVEFDQNRTIIAHLTSSANLQDIKDSLSNEVERYYQKPFSEQTIRTILKKDFNIDFPS